MTGRIESGQCQTGGTDEISTPSGFNTTTKQMRYHYIEDFIGNFIEWIDGVSGMTDSKAWVSSNPDDYADTNGPANYKQLAYTTTGASYIKAFGWDTDNPFLCYYSDSNLGSYTQGFCDKGYVVTSSYPVMWSGASWNNSGANLGLCSCGYAPALGKYATYGGRLLYTEPAQ